MNGLHFGRLVSRTSKRAAIAASAALVLWALMIPPAQSQTFTLLSSFQGSPDGIGPLAPVMRDGAGNFYGTTSEGGSASYGAVYKVDSSGKETVLYIFKGGRWSSPLSGGGSVRDAVGNLYGVTDAGGKYGYGTVYKLSPAR